MSRYVGALAVVATGGAHIEQYAVDSYSTVPTIGTLFLLNFIGAIVMRVERAAKSIGVGAQRAGRDRSERTNTSSRNGSMSRSTATRKSGPSARALGQP
jgi:hypothetical protein